MRVTRAEADKNRERIIETASRLFRERGFDGIGVAELMKVVGLTHGGFYGHFSSKEDLMAQACEHALKGSLDALQQVAKRGSEHALSGIASRYLSSAHRDQPSDGCMLAALGAEAARHNSPVRGVFTQGVRAVVDALTQLLPGKSVRKKRERALASYASMVGAIVLARAVDDAELSEEVLKSVLASITESKSP
jgi:TetR/AcrR family transcriptional repressor of nem operon